LTAEEKHARCTGKHLDLAPSLAKKGRGLESALAGTYDCDGPPCEHRKIRMIGGVACEFWRQLIEHLRSCRERSDPRSDYDLRRRDRFAVGERKAKSSTMVIDPRDRP
jgi:hypothetical protein